MNPLKLLFLLLLQAKPIQPGCMCACCTAAYDASICAVHECSNIGCGPSDGTEEDPCGEPAPLAPPPPHAPAPASTPVAGPIASLIGDPHSFGAHGDRSDLRGEDRAIYVVLSDRNVSFAVQMEHHSFRTTHSKLTVNGSWARAAYWVLRTTSKRRLIDVSFQAKYPRKAILTELDGNGTELLQDAPPLVIDNLQLHLRRRQLTVQTGRWRMSAESTVGYPHLNKLRLNIKIQPTYHDWLDVVAPHGDDSPHDLNTPLCAGTLSRGGCALLLVSCGSTACAGPKLLLCSSPLSESCCCLSLKSQACSGRHTTATIWRWMAPAIRTPASTMAAQQRRAGMPEASSRPARTRKEASRGSSATIA